MQTRFLPLLCLPIAIGLSVPAMAQHVTPQNESPAAKQGTVPKERPQPMERHTRTTWHYHSGPKRSAIAADSTASKTQPSQNENATDAGK